MTSDDKPQRERPAAFPHPVADRLAGVPAVMRGAEFSRKLTSELSSAQADAKNHETLVRRLHLQAIDARARLESGHWSDARRVLDELIEGLDQLEADVLARSDISETSNR
jgi:hypothetical protein